MKLVLPLLLALFVAACAPQPKTPTLRPTALDLELPFAEAAKAEQLGSSLAATESYLSLLDRAIANPSAPLALEAVLASVDSLVTKKTPGLIEITEHHALAFRAPGGMQLVRERLGSAFEKAEASGPFVRPSIARAAYLLAMHEGDADAAALWRSRIGCARQATVIGPLDGFPLTALGRATPLDDAKAKLSASYPGIPPFAKSIEPMVLFADECRLPVDTTSHLSGLRALVVDVEIPRPMRMGITLRSGSAAVVTVGGRLAIERGYAKGGASLFSFGRAEVPAGRARVVVRLAQKGEANHIELGFHDDQGLPLAVRAPLPGESASVEVAKAEPLHFRTFRDSDEERALVAAAHLALDDGRSAAFLLEDGAEEKSPLIDLLYARAIHEGGHLPRTRAIEASRGAYERVLSSWPSSWEATLGRALFAGRRYGGGEGPIEMLRELHRARDEKKEARPILHAFEAKLGAVAKMPDIAEGALASAKASLSGTPFWAHLEGSLRETTGKPREAWACTTKARDHNSLLCHDAKLERGDHEGALSELSRLRELRDSPTALRDLELSHKLALLDEAAVMRLLAEMPEAARLVSLLALAPRDSKEPLGRELLERVGARDLPLALGPLRRALGNDPAKTFEGEAARLIHADRQRKQLADAGTAILLHRERYEIADNGLLHYVLHDLRRVSGAMDVELGAQMAGPLIEGRDSRTTTRRRVFKPDGRIIEPDAAPHAEQAHTDLTQLQPGDYIEQVIEGFALPDATGHFVVDTPDLLPERTRVREAVIEIRRPKGLSLAVAAHELLGEAKERIEGEARITSFALRDGGPRRLEFGVPRMDRDVAVSFGASSWELNARAFAESLALLEDSDPLVSRWAREAAKGLEKGPKLLDELSKAAGKAVPVASDFELSDWAALHSRGGQTRSARTILELRQGSRSILVHRALRELGVASTLRFAEREPFSSRTDHPAHFGRFQHPLVVAHLPEGDVWLDLDVPGPPLPAGILSPELRGRPSLGTDGSMVKVPSGESASLRDDVVLRLKLDAAGHAKGKATVVLRGRQAQMLADALEQVVGSYREEMLRDVVLGFLPIAHVDEVALTSGEASFEVAVEAEISVPSYAQAEGAGWVIPGVEPLHVTFPHAFAASLGSTFASLAERESALSIDLALQYRIERHIELPEGMKLASELPAFEASGPHLEAARKASLEDGVLREVLTLSMPTGTVPRAEYDAFIEAIRAVDDAFLRGTRFAQ